MHGPSKRKQETATTKVDGLGAMLDEAEAPKPKKALKKPPEDLDLDAAWSRD